MLRTALVLIEPPKVQFHLSFEACLEAAELQIDCYEPGKTPVVEQQIDVEILVTDRDPLLAGDKRKIGAEFQKETFQFAEDGCFEIAFAISIFQAEEVEQIRVTQNELGREPVGS